MQGGFGGLGFLSVCGKGALGFWSLGFTRVGVEGLGFRRLGLRGVWGSGFSEFRGFKGG